ncbi:unnamed protein product [Effrenium voratum]|uniref:Uncharacterized protein n=1 Tax=Effrenium voratum TaxID=2562239 RepID=A0AA36JE18_9DINO|nr:unnamed protein product [Effrenium voratum]CAJ1403964.1 unnamed protein product [Effrenium voratum]CAJ1460750.1 unnamed protein product [Effrenium voratum]
MDRMEHKYSVWLMPQPGDLQTKLDSLVAQVSHRFRGPPFDFHVTLLGGIKSSDLEALKGELQRLASRLEPFEVHFPKESLAVFETWNQSLLLLAELGPKLRAANLAAVQQFKDPSAQEANFAAPSRQPHGSLLYGPQPLEERKQAEAWVRQEAPWFSDGWSFTASHLVLYETDHPADGWEGVPSWKKVAEFPMAA